MENTAELRTALVWDEAFLNYRFSDTHPMNPVRLKLTHRLAKSLGVLDPQVLARIAPPVATDAELATIHSIEYIAQVKAASSDASSQDAATLANIADVYEAVGLGTEDCPVFADLHDSSARIAGGSLAAAKAIWAGEVDRAVNFAGGMHHAQRSAASGFCIYNDAAIAIQYMLDQGAERVAYVDVDAHHGDGVEQAFYNDPRVLTISIHETGLLLFPGTGFAKDIGGPQAEGYAVNVAVPASVGDAGFLRAVHAVVPQLLRAYAPEVLVTQHGADGHRHDPLADLNLSVDGQRQLMLDASDWSHDFAGGKWLALGGGGYSPMKVVPRAWAHLIAIAADTPIPLKTEIPEEWRQLAATELGLPDASDVVKTMSDGADVWWRSWEVGYDPADSTDQSIMATRKAVFPFHGLDPWFD
ncbi:acetoin utilization protein AcuC [Yaniella flava]|uniref:Acetoin utilization protein AcuC n=1 Tax=Yaniella flava TaxID=287930 RepID=A0ABN2UL15_9MICC